MPEYVMHYRFTAQDDDMADEVVKRIADQGGFEPYMTSVEAMDQDHEHEDSSEGPGEGPCTDACVATHPGHAETRGSW